MMKSVNNLSDLIQGAANKQQPPFLGGLTVAEFLQEYWQKKPLFVKNAFADFEDLLSPDELAGLACEDDVQSRLVKHQRGKWQLQQGPFAEDTLTSLPAKGWALLVQSVNHHLPEAERLMRQFDFIPQARLDDLMMSFAPDGGGVGPHFDSYDVFLIQGLGKRLWKISEQTDLSLVPDAPLRILQHFDTCQEYYVEPGDLLYLPPKLAHWGIAIGNCMTYSVGFRAPSAQELGREFLGYLQDNITLQGMYQDADLQPQNESARVSAQMVQKVSQMLQSIRWDTPLVEAFLGSYLSEPKPHVVFDPPRRISLAAFMQRVQPRGVALHGKTIMLIAGDTLYINGEALNAALNTPALRQLANRRALAHMADLNQQEWQQLHHWYLAGVLQPI